MTSAAPDPEPPYPDGDPLSAPVRVTADDGSRYYPWKDPTSGEERQFWSVTTALSAKEKGGLKWWAAKLAAQRAMDNLPKLIMSQRFEPCGNTYKRDNSSCGQCSACTQRWVEMFHIGESTRRKHEGSALHDALEAFIKFGPDGIPSVAVLGQKYAEDHAGIFDALPPYLKTLRQWIEDFAVEPTDFEASEMTVFNVEHEYGGTLDAIWRIFPRNKASARLLARITGHTNNEHALVVMDCKSREGDGKQLYDEHPLQLAPYRAATHCMPSKEDRTLFPMPRTVGAVVLQIRPDGYTCEPVDAGERAFSAFLDTLNLYRWIVAEGSASIAVKSFPVPDGFEWPPPVPGEEKPPPRKRAAKKATPKPTTEAGVSSSIKNATLDGIAKTGQGRPGAMLTDEDIPF